MNANVGDRLILEGTHVGDPRPPTPHGGV